MAHSGVAKAHVLKAVFYLGKNAHTHTHTVASICTQPTVPSHTQYNALGVRLYSVYTSFFCGKEGSGRSGGKHSRFFSAE